MAVKMIVTVPVPDGHTDQRFFEFNSREFEFDVDHNGAIVVRNKPVGWDTTRRDIHQIFGAGHWSRVEFFYDR